MLQVGDSLKAGRSENENKERRAWRENFGSFESLKLGE